MAGPEIELAFPAGLTRRVAAFVAGARLAEIPEPAIEAAKVAILDTLGVALAATRLELARLILEHVRGLGGSSTCTVLGSGFRASPEAAALANGTLAHGLDFDDKGHVSTYTLPAVLAVGELVGASGPQVLEAYIVAREVSVRMTEVIEARRAEEGGPTYRGWYRVGGIGPIGAAAGAARLLGLDIAGVQAAIGLAASSSTGLRRNQGTMARALHAGNGAMLGVQAALLARAGFSADPEILEAPLGLLSLLCLSGECDPTRLERLGSPFELEGGARIKAFPACAPSHKPLAAILALQAEAGFGPEDVEAIDADLHEFSLFRGDPEEEAAAGFSLPYLLAVAVVDGRLGVEQILRSTTPDARVRSLMSRVRNAPGAQGTEAERVTVHLRDGRILAKDIRHAPTLTGDAIDAKLRDCASAVLDESDIHRLETQVRRLERLADIRELMATVGRR